MKNELHYLVKFTRKNKLNNMPNFCIWILLGVFLVPILLLNVWIGTIILFVYATAFLMIKREKETYMKGLLKFGSFLMLLGFEFFYLILIQFKISFLLLIEIIIFWVSYEIIFMFKLKLEMFSKKNNSTRRKESILYFIFGGTGVWCGIMLSNLTDTPFKLFLTCLLCSILIVGGISYFQKYIICRIIKN